jgi:hypothetical protein
MNVAEYIKNKQIRDSLPFTIRPTGEAVYILNGSDITPEQLEKLFPTTDPIVSVDLKKYKGENSDKTKNWFYGKKSY